MNFKSSTVQTFELEVTPTLASQMLATSVGNRNIRRWHVDLLAGAQRRGEWRLTHQGAAFDWNGALRDAHHRLMACVQSGVTISMLVTLGLDPAAFDAVDQGVNRNLSDLTGWDKRVAEPVRLATMIARGHSRVTTPQVQEIASGGVAAALTNLIDYCGTSRRYYSSAPMRLAAAATIMNGGDSTFVLGQYRALCLLSFDEMTHCSKALVRQVDSLKARAGQTRESLARGLRVFDTYRADLSKIQVSETDIAVAVEMVRTVLLESIGEGRSKTTKRTTRSFSKVVSAADEAIAATDKWHMT
jgi:hypothetical protein